MTSIICSLLDRTQKAQRNTVGPLLFLELIRQVNNLRLLALKQSVQFLYRFVLHLQFGSEHVMVPLMLPLEIPYFVAQFVYLFIFASDLRLVFLRCELPWRTDRGWHEFGLD